MTMDSKQKCDVEIEESVALLGTKRVKYTMENDMSSSQAGVSSDVLDDKKDLGEDIDTGPCDVTGTVGLRSAESGSGKGIQGDVPASASAAEIEPLSNGETAEGRADMGSEKASTASNGEKPVRLRACERKRLKREAMHAEFLEERKRKRKQVKERRKEKYKEMTEEEKAAHRLPKWIRMADGCKQRIVVDMGWDKEMNAKELTNAVTQVNRCYSINRRATPPVQLYITDNSEHTCSVFDKSAPDYKRWDIHFKTEPYLELFPKEELVYLTADSPNVIETLDETKVYIIGGMVDHNRLKYACYERATEQGIQHAQLPIGEHMQMNSRRVLTINHVFEILTRYKQFNDWKQAFVQTIPERKQRAGNFDKKGKATAQHSKTERVGGASNSTGASGQATNEISKIVEVDRTDFENSVENDLEHTCGNQEGQVVTNEDDCESTTTAMVHTNNEKQIMMEKVVVDDSESVAAVPAQTIPAKKGDIELSNSNVDENVASA